MHTIPVGGPRLQCMLLQQGWLQISPSMHCCIGQERVWEIRRQTPCTGTLYQSPGFCCKRPSTCKIQDETPGIFMMSMPALLRSSMS